ncbi:MAG TPA: flagellin, partial [Rhizobiales bacterium]|nr:flagellin [Hyphomicrobiales bacterium]
MAANSILTNNSAFVALQNLNATNRELDEVQSRVNTGKRVAGPKDNGAIFAIAQNMRSKVNGLAQVQTNLSNAISAVDVAVSAGQSVSDLLNLMKEKAVLA